MLMKRPIYQQVTGIYSIRNRHDIESSFFAVGVIAEDNKYHVLIFDPQHYSCFLSNQDAIKTNYDYNSESPVDEATTTVLVEQFNNVNAICLNKCSSKEYRIDDFNNIF